MGSIPIASTSLRSYELRLAPPVFSFGNDQQASLAISQSQSKNIINKSEMTGSPEFVALMEVSFFSCIHCLFLFFQFKFQCIFLQAEGFDNAILEDAYAIINSV